MISLKTLQSWKKKKAPLTVAQKRRRAMLPKKLRGDLFIVEYIKYKKEFRLHFENDLGELESYELGPIHDAMLQFRSWNFHSKGEPDWQYLGYWALDTAVEFDNVAIQPSGRRVWSLHNRDRRKPLDLRRGKRGQFAHLD
jgi:hypothetical protein